MNEMSGVEEKAGIRAALSPCSKGVKGGQYGLDRVCTGEMRPGSCNVLNFT